MAYMYILECADRSYYTGSTKNLEQLHRQHQQGLGANHTAKRLPVKLIFCEYYERVVDAFEREKQVQGWSRKKKQALIVGDTNLLHKLAECQNETHYSRLTGFGGDGFDTSTNSMHPSAGFDSAQPPEERSLSVCAAPP
ncbi:GIY-YIG nuclease family protein [Brasilonema octagenarum UFV-E1]|uniref:GIY-YIG nuclease family protein n=2 Tax=Brasilonema TaxID=383614 RepID=A0A856MGQ0_9CYAN|nr:MULTISPECIES: GIY-YIG nuclease family protein [Brasilonema]NMF66084.1 GIY-YIG nuclease family protein [Brasilonema octagenarum UFV-OR1]QDL09434.1 GIY-YIG nuclease family protein [Brasilonema sennae CENA114]QDL15790.1 GIY-YIG nuclease family protein [Brasilonema octagenarum UFV-E1]